MKKKLVEDLKTIAQIGYCHAGRDSFVWYVKLMKKMSKSEEVRQMCNCLLREVKLIDKNFEEYEKKNDG